MTARVVKEVELGFVEEAEDPEQLTSPHFPSKVGGKPAWLDNIRLPRPEDTECGTCRKPMTFLLQVYAPVPVNDSAAPEGAEYHRTMFVFMCRNPGCHGIGVSKSFKVLRCQLDEVVDSTSCPTEVGLCADISNLLLSTEKTKGDDPIPTLNDLGSMTLYTCKSLPSFLLHSVPVPHSHARSSPAPIPSQSRIRAKPRHY